MAAIIYSVLKEFYIEIHTHKVKARILSPVHDENLFTIQVDHYFKNRADADANDPTATFNSYANAERHLLSYLEAFQNTLDLGGEVATGNKF